MGWGISIDQDEDGFVFCSEADFETGIDDYTGFPPSSYEYIRDGVEQAHSEIDWMRDEMGLDSAKTRCWEAFADAKSSYTHLEESEKDKLHKEYIKDLKARIKLCKVDVKIKKEKEREIEFFLKNRGAEIEALENEVKEIEARLAKKRAELDKVKDPLVTLEDDLARIMAPAREKDHLKNLLKCEEDSWEENIV